ncbi:Glycosyltransferase involved in cell wall bisynthesis [Fulvimarina manganoxydans]|uniref:Glycosyltransferase involved in cell wall bisynthesis n=1 Tax=Fulvimarina manganoxydans TaxID=937218 RepID=A0A1W2DZV4_9HYPH|nr:glycosyltransferase family 4 protein [Fulvimarina manganoxydans]SMD02652.1 Glycosyltransferase involved in cell wall bisynthesis [Fulvimarina manganoxydans]
MKIAFYAPMKSPEDPRPSGDRTVARQLLAALRLGGHEVDIASTFRSWDSGSPERQARIEALGRRLANRIVKRARGGPRPYDLWFTYHLYHKAPDWLGPLVAQSLAIPYVVAEASVANKRREGAFATGYRGSLEALRAASLVVGLNPADRAGVEPHLLPGAAYRDLPPWLDARPFLQASLSRPEARSALAARFAGSVGPEPILLAVGMMRKDQKRLSYLCLVEALARVSQPFKLAIVGTGPVEAEIRQAFAPFGANVVFLGAQLPEAMPEIYAGADLLVWPAIKEAFGMALLEAQAAGTPVIAGASGGVAAIVEDGVTGRLTPEGDAAAFAAALQDCLAAGDRLRAMGEAALGRVAERHDLPAAAKALDAMLQTLARSTDPFLSKAI